MKFRWHVFFDSKPIDSHEVGWYTRSVMVSAATSDEAEKIALEREWERGNYTRRDRVTITLKDEYRWRLWVEVQMIEEENNAVLSTASLMSNTDVAFGREVWCGQTVSARNHLFAKYKVVELERKLHGVSISTSKIECLEEEKRALWCEVIDIEAGA